MYKFIIKRLLMIIPMMLVIVFIVFCLVSLNTVNPGRAKLGPEATEEEVYAFNDSYGMYDPLPVRYINYVWDLFHGDFGTSYYTERPVVEDIMYRWPNTVKLTLMSLVIAMAIGIPIGVLSAVKQYSLLDRIASTAAMLMASIPTFCMATVFMLIFSYQLRWVNASFTNDWKGWILPALTLGLSYSSQFLRFSRSTMLDTIRQDYIRTARSKGAAEKTVIWKHAFRNALLPLITVTGTTLGTLLGGAVVMESVYVIPGLGTLVVDALNQNDVPIVLGAITMLAFTFLLIMLVVDILYAVVDPRIRAKYSSYGKKKSASKKGAGQDG